MEHCFSTVIQAAEIPHLAQIFVLLLWRSMSSNLVDTEVGMGTITETNGTARTRNLFVNDTVSQETHIASSIFL